MRIHHLRSATFILHVGDHRLLVDPMLSDEGSLMSYRFLGGERRRNPLVPLPPSAEQALSEVTGCVITHCQRKHLDHLDGPGMRFLRDHRTPVWAHHRDVAWLRRRGLAAEQLVDGSLGARVEAVPTSHGRGLVGWLMGPGTGWFLAFPGEPGLYITGDTVLTETVAAAIRRLEPQIIVAPAGSANLGFGGDILFSFADLLRLAEMAPSEVVFNHLEALDHCPTTRLELRSRLAEAGLEGRMHVPEDGETIEIR
jgi:L-ascorbate metabolism protein UlaG (beta-lactamase superfamily)